MRAARRRRGSTSCAACRAIRCTTDPQTPTAADLGQTQLRQPARCAARRPRRLRRALAVQRRRTERHSLPSNGDPTRLHADRTAGGDGHHRHAAVDRACRATSAASSAPRRPRCKQNLSLMRDAIDKHYHRHRPLSEDARRTGERSATCAACRVDPITGTSDTWTVGRAADARTRAVYDVKSGSPDDRARRDCLQHMVTRGPAARRDLHRAASGDRAGERRAGRQRDRAEPGPAPRTREAVAVGRRPDPPRDRCLLAGAATAAGPIRDAARTCWKMRAAPPSDATCDRSTTTR